MAEVFTIVTDRHLYQGAGLVNRWFHRMGDQLDANVRNRTPVRSGALLAGITKDYTHDGLRIQSVDIASTAPHSKYVLFGTAQDGVGLIMTPRARRNLATVGRIRSALETGGPGSMLSALGGQYPRGLWMKLSDSRDGIHLVVHGQKHNNFLLKGYADTARTHRSLKPILPGIVEG